MTRNYDTSPAGSTQNDVLIPKDNKSMGAYIANPIAGLDLTEVSDNLMGPAIGIGSTILGKLVVTKWIEPRLPASVGKFAPLISGVVAAIATVPLALWKRDVGVQAAGTALLLGVTMQAAKHFGTDVLGAYTANELGSIPSFGRQVRNEALPSSVNSALNVNAYGGGGESYGRAFGQYVG